jgi:outer membrane protein insertion porin family
LVKNLFTNIQVYITKLQGQNIWIEINAVERPQLSSFSFKGVKKSDAMSWIRNPDW